MLDLHARDIQNKNDGQFLFPFWSVAFTLINTENSPALLVAGSYVYRYANEFLIRK